LNHRLLILIIFLFPTIVLGQKKYKFMYRAHLTSQKSTFTTHQTDTLLETDKCNLTFTILDNNGEAVPSANIVIKNNTADTIIHSDLNGFVTATLPSGVFTISINSYQFTAIKLDNFKVKANTKINISTLLGQSNALRIALIYSMRKLTNDEIERIVDALSKGGEDNELIKDKTCYILWEI